MDSKVSSVLTGARSASTASTNSARGVLGVLALINSGTRAEELRRQLILGIHLSSLVISLSLGY